MTLSEKDFFVLTKTIRGIQERIDRMPVTTRNKTANMIKEEFDGMMEGLIDVCNELRGRIVEA